MRGLLCTHAPASAHNKYTKPSSIKRQMPPLSPQNPDKVGGCGGVVQLGSRFSFWIKTPKKRKKVKRFPLVLNPWGGLGVCFSVSPKNVHFWNKKRLKMRVKDQTQHQRGPRGMGRWNRRCLPHQWTGGAKMSILPVEWGLLGGHTGSQNEEFVCLPLQQVGGDSGSQNRGGVSLM